MTVSDVRFIVLIMRFVFPLQHFQFQDLRHSFYIPVFKSINKHCSFYCFTRLFCMMLILELFDNHSTCII